MEAHRVEGIAHAADATIHHVGGGRDVDTGLGLGEGLADQHLDGFVVEDDVVRHQPVMAVIGIGIERHVADDADLRHRFLERAHGPVTQIVRPIGFLSARDFFSRGTTGKRASAGMPSLAAFSAAFSSVGMVRRSTPGIDGTASRARDRHPSRRLARSDR